MKRINSLQMTDSVGRGQSKDTFFTANLHKYSTRMLKIIHNVKLYLTAAHHTSKSVWEFIAFVILIFSKKNIFAVDIKASTAHSSVA